MLSFEVLYDTPFPKRQKKAVKQKVVSVFLFTCYYNDQEFPFVVFKVKTNIMDFRGFIKNKVFYKEKKNTVIYTMSVE